MAVKFNQTYGDVLKLPEPYILDDTAVVPGVDGQKMSKSYGNTIDVFARGKELKKQVMGIVTDSTPVEPIPRIRRLPVFQIWNLFATAEDRAEMAERARAGGLGYGDVKKDVLERLLAYFERRAHALRWAWVRQPARRPSKTCCAPARDAPARAAAPARWRAVRQRFAGLGPRALTR